MFDTIRIAKTVHKALKRRLNEFQTQEYNEIEDLSDRINERLGLKKTPVARAAWILGTMIESRIISPEELTEFGKELIEKEMVPKKPVRKITAKKPKAKVKAKKTISEFDKASALVKSIEKDINAQTKKVVAARKKAAASRAKVAKRATKASEAAVKKAVKDLRSDVTKLDKLTAKGTVGKAELRAAKLLAQVKGLEEKAMARVVPRQHHVDQLA